MNSITNRLFNEHYDIIKRTIKDLAMNFLDAITVCLMDKYFKFSGRAQPREFWWFVLFSSVLYVLATALNHLSNPTMTAIILSIVIQLFLVVPYIAVTVRRLHDTNKSGWYYCTLFIPFIGIFIQLYYCSQPGTVGPNQFRPDPLNPERAPKPEKKIPDPEKKIE
jgi:uncharacterized membrane protein YhaH (DUF805 family)